MGLFGYFKSEDEKRAQEVRSGAVAPSRSERQRCYLARDAYFACLDANGIVDAIKDEKRAAAACGAQNADFERDCATQWVSLLSLFFPFLLPTPFPCLLEVSIRAGAELDGRRLGMVLFSSWRNMRPRVNPACSWAGNLLQEVASAGHPEKGKAERVARKGGQPSGYPNRGSFNTETVRIADT